MTASTVVLWRHGQTDWNATGRYQGQGDVPLNDAGLAQARTVAPVLAAYCPARIVSSDLSRALQTAEILGELTGVRVEPMPGLQEINVGTWVGLTNEEVFELSPDFKQALREGRDFRRSDTGETGSEAGSRVATTLLDAAEATPDGETLLAVGHGFSLRVAITLLMGLDFAHNRLFSGLWNCAWTVMQPAGDHWRLQAYNHHIPHVGTSIGAHNIS